MEVAPPPQVSTDRMASLARICSARMISGVLVPTPQPPGRCTSTPILGEGKPHWYRHMGAIGEESGFVAALGSEGVESRPERRERVADTDGGCTLQPVEDNALSPTGVDLAGQWASSLCLG